MRVRIESLAFGGAGVAREEGKVYFVRGGLPGDVLDIKVIKDKGAYAEAVVNEILEPSGERVKAVCEVFGACGGCQLQELGYQAQLREKGAIVRESLKRIGGFSDVEVEPVFGSPESYGYRNRVSLAAWFYAGSWHVGYNRGGTTRKVRIGSCPVADGHINKAIARLSETLERITDPGLPLEKVLISSSAVGAYITLVPAGRKRGDSLKPLLTHLARYEETENVSVIGRGESEFGYTSRGLTYSASPSLFVQANYEVNEAMVKTVLEWARDGLGNVIDLYSGTGNFAIPLSRVSELVIAVEVNRRSVRYAVRNAESNAAGNIEFINLSARDYIDGMALEENDIDLLVLDPPREGARDIIEGIGSVSPEKIIYISCDPATLSRDLKALGGFGYALEKIRPFDMFPQTCHIETIALLGKTGPR